MIIIIVIKVNQQDISNLHALIHPCFIHYADNVEQILFPFLISITTAPTIALSTFVTISM